MEKHVGLNPAWFEPGPGGVSPFERISATVGFGAAGTAAALAAIIDPQRKVPGWWDESTLLPPERCYHGPPDLHTAREHSWRLEDWLIERGYQIAMLKDKTIVWESGKKWHETSKTWSSPNHTAALVAAIERIANEVR